MQHFKNYANRYFFLLIAFIIGVSAGAFTVNGLSSTQRDQLGSYLTNFLQLLDNQPVDNSELFKLSAMLNLKIVAALWILGVTIIGVPLIFVSIGIRGFITGFSSGFIIQALGAKGVAFSIIALLPKEMIIVPCIIAIGVNGINFSLNIIKNRSAKSISKKSLKSSFLSYCFVTGFYSCFILGAVLLEAYIIPVFIRMFIPILNN